MSNFILIVTYLTICLICLVSGFGVTILLWPKKWYDEMILVCPIIGAGLLIILTTALNCLGLPVRIFSLKLIILLAGFGLCLLLLKPCRESLVAFYKNKRLIYTFLPVIISFISGLFVMLPLFLYKGFNPYNDTFTYIAIADYVLDNGFLKNIQIDNLHPVLSQVLLYQKNLFRMGAQYYLSLMTAIFNCNLSISVYMPVAASFIFLFSISIWIFCKIGLGLINIISLVAIIFTSIHLSFPIGHILIGFFPQTIGMAFSIVVLSIWIRNDIEKKLTIYLLIGILIAALIISYSEISPFVFVASFVVIICRVIKGKQNITNAIINYFIPISIGSVLSHLFFYGMCKNLNMLSQVVVGWDVKYTLWDYVLMFYSFVPLNYGKPVEALIHPFVNIALNFTASFFVFILLKEFLFAAEFKNILTRLGKILIPFMVVLIYFMFFKQNPWNQSEMGQSWSIYKTIQYGFFLFPPMFAVAWHKAIYHRSKIIKYLTVLSSCIYMVAGIGINIGYAHTTANIMAKYTGNYENPFFEYFKLKEEVMKLNNGMPINLEIPSTAQKHRQLVAYFLKEIPLKADWRGDSYIYNYLDKNDNELSSVA